MQSLATSLPEPVPPYFLVRHRRASLAVGVDLQFIALLDAYRPSGGLARTQETLDRFMRRDGPDVVTMARWVAQREVVYLDWNGRGWLPNFQWDPVNMVPLPQLAPVLLELNAVYSHWALAAWFAQPNPWLEDERPADVLVSRAGDVLNAARADRFVALG